MVPPVPATWVYATTYRAGDPCDNQVQDLGFMPQVPARGDTVHFSTTGDDGDSLAWHVFMVSWSLGSEHFGMPGVWHAEIAMRA